MLKVLIVTHRWLGVALCTLFLLWFPSGIGMMYWGMPAISARDRLERAPALDPSRIVLSPQEAAELAWSEPAPNQVRLTTFDGRPSEMQLTSFDGEPLFAVRNAEGMTRLVALDGRQIEEFNRARLIDIVRRIAPSPGNVETASSISTTATTRVGVAGGGETTGALSRPRQIRCPRADAIPGSVGPLAHAVRVRPRSSCSGRRRAER